MRILAVLLATAIVGAVATTVSPTQHNYGKWAVGVASPPFFFRVTLPAGSALTDSIDLSIVGADAGDFNLSNRGLIQQRGMRIECGLGGTLYSPPAPGACDIPVDFVPQGLGARAAQLQIVDRAGTTTMATLRGEGVLPLCEVRQVHCNYLHMYRGSIQIRIIDSTANSERKARFEDDFALQVNYGAVTCSGRRTELETNFRQGVPVDEITGQGAIAGSGMLAVEFQQNSQGKLEYVLTFACPYPAMTRTSTNFLYGTSHTETFPGGLADWRSSERLADPQAATSDTMSVLQGRHANTDWDPDNQAGRYMEAMWELRRR